MPAYYYRAASIARTSAAGRPEVVPNVPPTLLPGQGYQAVYAGSSVGGAQPWGIKATWDFGVSPNWTAYTQAQVEAFAQQYANMSAAALAATLGGVV